MKKFSLDDMKGGWFVGGFEPTCFKTDQFEVACKQYKKGDIEERHVHKVATEFTVILKGVVEMNGKVFKDQDIIMLDPGESADFKVMEDVMTVVVKFPSILGDKYLVDL